MYDSAWETDAFQDEMLDLAAVNTPSRGTKGNTQKSDRHELETITVNSKLHTIFFYASKYSLYVCQLCYKVGII